MEKEKSLAEELAGFQQPEDHGFWITALLILLFLNQSKEEKEPTIKIYIGGDK